MHTPGRIVVKTPDGWVRLSPLRVGDRIYGFCNGKFGRDSYENKRVEALGADWVVVRDGSGHVLLYEGSPEDLLPYTNPDLDRENA